MDACIVLGVTSLAIALLLGSAAFAQMQSAPNNAVVTIDTGNKFQQVLASSATERLMLRITNNNTNGDTCWVFVGSGRASKDDSIAVITAGRVVCPLLAVCFIGHDPSSLRV
jgi:hypothetical protein